MKRQQTVLGIIAGGGALPKALIMRCRTQKRPVYVLGLKGHADTDLLEHTNGAFIRIGAVGKAVRLMKRSGVQDIVFIGSVRRPSIPEILPDWKALMILMRAGFRLLGDDSLLKIILAEADKVGFRVVGIDTLMPELLAPAGIYGKVRPTRKDLADIERGVSVAKTLGRVDVGQAVIVQQGLILSVEGIEGTARLIQRTAALKRKGGGGVLVKVAKPQQDRRVDLPTIGPDTVQAVFDAGFRGIAVESGAALLVEAEKMIRLADRKGLFVMGVSCQN